MVSSSSHSGVPPYDHHSITITSDNTDSKSNNNLSVNNRVGSGVPGAVLRKGSSGAGAISNVNVNVNVNPASGSTSSSTPTSASSSSHLSHHSRGESSNHFHVNYPNHTPSNDLHVSTSNGNTNGPFSSTPASSSASNYSKPNKTGWTPQQATNLIPPAFASSSSSSSSTRLMGPGQTQFQQQYHQNQQYPTQVQPQPHGNYPHPNQHQHQNHHRLGPRPPSTIDDPRARDRTGARSSPSSSPLPSPSPTQSHFPPHLQSQSHFPPSFSSQSQPQQGYVRQSVSGSGTPYQSAPSPSSRSRTSYHSPDLPPNNNNINNNNNGDSSNSFREVPMRAATVPSHSNSSSGISSETVRGIGQDSASNRKRASTTLAALPGTGAGAGMTRTGIPGAAAYYDPAGPAQSHLQPQPQVIVRSSGGGTTRARNGSGSRQGQSTSASASGQQGQDWRMSRDLGNVMGRLDVRDGMNAGAVAVADAGAGAGSGGQGMVQTLSNISANTTTGAGVGVGSRPRSPLVQSSPTLPPTSTSTSTSTSTAGRPLRSVPSRRGSIQYLDEVRGASSSANGSQAQQQGQSHPFSPLSTSNISTSTSTSTQPSFLGAGSGSVNRTPSHPPPMGASAGSGWEDSPMLTTPRAQDLGTAGFGASAPALSAIPSTPSTSLSTASASASMCGNCGKPVKGQFVRAMTQVFHLDCFRCKDCGTIVASKFFPVDDPDGSTHPLCERDYFARLGLICGKCDKALRGSYITACSKKYHVEHFTCSACDTVFGPQDSYYEHDNEVYCHFHYSTRFAVKCVGCANAILKQFVEINRNQKDECWHPECYMIHKFWNVKLTSKFKATPAASAASSIFEEPLAEDETNETAETLRAKQQRMETQVEHIWRVLSAFEESSAACISEMLRFVSSSQYLEAVFMAEHFILHVEVLFAAIDDLEAQFAMEDAKGMSHVREARMLCRKTVNFFSLLAHTQDSQEERATVTQELLALVTGLAHYLKILIRIALTGSLKLEREFGNDRALDYLLDRLALLGKDDRISTTKQLTSEPLTQRSKNANTSNPPGFTPSTKDVAYGFSSLAVEWVGESVLKGRPPPGRGLDHCVDCDKPIDEGCIRLGLFERWHPGCLRCGHCSKTPQQVVPPDLGKADPQVRQTTRVNVQLLREFAFESGSNSTRNAITIVNVSCPDHIQPGQEKGFASVSRLEQYAYLLNVALRRLYDHLKEQGVVPDSPPPSIPSHDNRSSFYDAYRDSSEIKRLKSVNIDRKLSATARTPQRSTVVESPSGKIAKSDNNNAQRYGGSLESGGDLTINPNLSGSRSTSALSHSSNQQLLSSTGPSDSSSGLTVIRPAFARNNTHIRIMDDSAGTTSSSPVNDKGEGEDGIPFVNADGVTLADIPQMVEAEQARIDRRRSPLPEGRPLLSELTPLEAVTIKHFALQALTKSPLAHLIDIDDILELMEVRKNVWWNKLFKTGKDKKDVKRKGVFGVPLEILVEKTGSDSQLGLTNAQLRVPEFIDNVISAMKQMDMSVEGIFRKNGNIKRLNQVAEAMDRDAASVNLVDDNPVQLAALLKKFLRDLPEPLMTFKLHKLFCAAQVLPNEEDRLRCLHLLVCLLPKANRDTAEVLFVFLKWVASFSHIDEETGSRMDIQNLATVISGSILYSKGHALQDDSFVSISVITSLIDNQDFFYHVPVEIEYALREGFPAILASHVDNSPPKSIYAACTSYIKKRGAGPYTQTQRLPITPGSGNGNGSSTPRNTEFLHGDPSMVVPTLQPGVVTSMASSSRATPTSGSRPSSWALNQQTSCSSAIPSVSSQQQQHTSTLTSQPSGGQTQHAASSSSSRGSMPSSPVVFDHPKQAHAQAQQPQTLAPAQAQRSSIERTRSPI